MIDPVFQNELMTALHTAVASYNETPDPDAAVIKAARAHDFNVEQTKRLVETFNTARTLYQYERGEKTAQFPLANQAAVMLALFKPTTPEVKAAAVDYSEYDQPERLAHEGHLTLAIGDLPVEKQAAGGSMTLNAQSERVYKQLNAKRAAADYVIGNSRQVALAADQCFQKLADWLRYLPHDEAVDKYARLKGAWQDHDKYGPILKRAHAWMPPALQLMQGPVSELGPVIEDRDLTPGMNAIKEAQQLIEEVCNLEAAGLQLQKEADADEHEFLDLILSAAPADVTDPLASFFPKRAQVETTERTTKVPANPQLLTPDDLATQLASMTKDVTVRRTSGDGGKREPGNLDKLIGKAFETAGGSGLESVFGTIEKARNRPIMAENAKMTERLRNVQRQVILQDLMINDPMISEAGPDTVQNAYIAVMQMAPEVTTNKEVMRAILRHAVHSVAISPFDASSWVELEKLIQDVRGTRPPTKQIRVDGK